MAVGQARKAIPDRTRPRLDRAIVVVGLLGSRKTCPDWCRVTGGQNDTLVREGGLSIGYTLVSTDDQDLTVQRQALVATGVSANRVYVDA